MCVCWNLFLSLPKPLACITSVARVWRWRSCCTDRIGRTHQKFIENFWSVVAVRNRAVNCPLLKLERHYLNDSNRFRMQMLRVSPDDFQHRKLPLFPCRAYLAWGAVSPSSLATLLHCGAEAPTSPPRQGGPLSIRQCSLALRCGVMHALGQKCPPVSIRKEHRLGATT